MQAARTPGGATKRSLQRLDAAGLEKKEAHMDRRVYERATSDEISWIAVMIFLMGLVVGWLIVEL